MPLHKKPTIKDVAAAAGVSHPTASRVLNGGLENYPLREETIQRVREAAARLNYRPNRFAQSLKTRRSYLIGVSIPGFASFNEAAPAPGKRALERPYAPGWAELLYGAASCLFQRGYQLVLVERHEERSGQFDKSDLFADAVDGLIYVSPTLKHQEYLDLSREGHSLVILGHCPPEIEIPSCDIDNRKACRTLADYLIGRGARRIAYVFTESMDLVVGRERLAGFHEALTRAGLSAPPELELTGRQGADEIQHKLEALLKAGQVDTILFAEWEGHRAALRAAQATGRAIPGDVRLAGFCDGWPHETEALGLTGIHIPYAEMAYDAAEMLIDRLEEKTDLPLHLEIQPMLKIRKTA